MTVLVDRLDGRDLIIDTVIHPRNLNLLFVLFEGTWYTDRETANVLNCTVGGVLVSDLVSFSRSERRAATDWSD